MTTMLMDIVEPKAIKEKKRKKIILISIYKHEQENI